MAIFVLKDKCTGCGLCVDSCPFDAIDMVDGKAIINEKCTMCGACIETCNFEAIIQEESEKKESDISAYKDVWVFAEQRKGKIMQVAYELLGEGRKLAGEIGDVDVCAVLIGNDISDLAQELIYHGADKVYLLEDELLENYTTDGGLTP